jgi:uroporphyrinogen III methyltransferase / synthase
MKVVVTRPRAQAAPLVERLERLGHEVVVCPLIEIEPTGPPAVEASGYEWAIVTSANAARELARRMRAAPAKIAAIGPGTASALREEGLEPSLVARVSTQEGLLAELGRPAGPVLFAGAEGARSLLADELGADVVPLYRTKEIRPPTFPEADLVVLASASAARAYGALEARAPVVSIGPETTRAAREAGVEVAAEATTHDLDGLVAAVSGAGGE